MSVLEGYVEVLFPYVIRVSLASFLVDEAAISPCHERFGGEGFYPVPQGVVVLMEETYYKLESSALGCCEQLFVVGGLFCFCAVDDLTAAGELEAFGCFAGTMPLFDSPPSFIWDL